MFRDIPLERLLVETDCPDMAPPPGAALLPLADPGGASLNHPLNLRLCIEALAADRGMSPGALGDILEQNVERFFF
jgi:Tat protein secretion system quality control protein TatD with DNase activity